MPEVFAISGAFGQPEGWVVTPKGNYGAPREGCPVERQIGKEGCRHPEAIALQTALRQSGLSVSVDGFIGPKTTEAVNMVLGTTLSPEQVAGDAPTLTASIQQKAVEQGPVPPAPPPPKPSVPPVPGTDDRVTPIASRVPTTAGWALVGLSAVVTGVGVWFTATSDR